MAGTSRIRMETAQKIGNLALDLGNKHRISKPVANVRCETCPTPGKTCPDTPAAALLESREHVCGVVILGHSQELDRRTTQEWQ